MKAIMSYKSKKIAIITAIILVLIAGIATGTYYFIKGNDETRAAYEENEELTQGNRGESETTQGQEEKTNSDESSNQDENIQNDENEESNGTDNESNSSTTTENNPNTSNGNNRDEELPNEEYTQTDIIEREEERETQNLTVAWNNIDLSRAQMSININTNKPVLEINKVAKLNSLNENDNAVQEGSKITYEITATNKSAEIDAKNVNISDIIPEGTKLVENSISNDGKVENEKISWTVDVSRNSSVTVSFTVEVVSTENDIKNVAVVDGKDTPETVNPVIETSKEAVLPEEKTAVAQGDEITYKITVTNKGNEKAIATVKDTIPTGTTLIPDSITNGGVETNSDIIWNVNVEKGQSVVLSFTVKVNEDNTLVGPISNTAYINEVPTEEVNTNVEAHIIFEENGGKEVLDVNGYAGDVIDDRNPVTTRVGYDFDGWYTEPEFTNKIEQLPEKMVAGTTTYYAKWIARDDTKYTVEFYYQKDGKYPSAATVKDLTRTGTTDTEASVTEADKTPDAEKGNYVFDEEAGNILSGTINGNGSLVLKVYFKEQFTVKYNPGTQGTFAEQTTGSLDYGTSTPTFEGEITGNAGYTFAGWTPEVAETVTADVTYTAQWRANTNTKYTVEYYYEEDGTYPETATASVERTGTTDTEASVTEADKTPDAEKGNYVFDEEAGNILSGTINGNGSLVLKVYFKEQFTVKYNPGTQGTFAEQTTGDLDYGTSTPTFNGEITGNAGYTFAGWTPEVAETVTADVTYTAQWRANTNTKYAVEYYYEEDGTYPETATASVERTGTTDTEASVTEADKTPDAEKGNYVFDEEAGNILSGTINGNGSLVLKVYFKEQFTVKYNPGTQGTFAEQTTGSLNYGTSTPTFNGEITGNAGYTFAGWTPEVAETVTADVTYTAQWRALPTPSLTLTKTALNTNKEKITELIYDADENNYMYYRLKVENTVKGSYPEIVTDEQTITDTLPLGMTTEGELLEGVTAKTIYDKDGEKRTKITWKVNNIGYDEEAKQIDIKVKLDEKVFKGQEVDGGTETTVISDIKAEQVKDFNVGRSEDRDNTMSMFVRFASPTSGNSGYLYAGTTKAANRNIPSGETYVPEYNDNTINGNMNDEMALATMLDDFVTANNDGTMSKYTAYGLPTTADVKRFLKNNYGISLTDNQVVLWYKVAIAEGETSRTRRYKITNNKTGEVTNKDIDMEECSYHIDGIIVDVRSLGEKIPDGASVNVVNTAKVENASNIWNKSADSISTLIYYNTKQATTQTSNILFKALSKVEKEEINDENIDEVIEKIENNEIKNEIVEEDKEETANSTENKVEENIVEENIVDKEENVESSTENKEETEVNEEDNILNNEVVQDNEIDLNNSEISGNEETIRNSENE